MQPDRGSASAEEQDAGRPWDDLHVEEKHTFLHFADKEEEAERQQLVRSSSLPSLVSSKSMLSDLDEGEQDEDDCADGADDAEGPKASAPGTGKTRTRRRREQRKMVMEQMRAARQSMKEGRETGGSQAMAPQQRLRQLSLASALEGHQPSTAGTQASLGSRDAASRNAGGWPVRAQAGSYGLVQAVGGAAAGTWPPPPPPLPPSAYDTKLSL